MIPIQTNKLAEKDSVWIKNTFEHFVNQIDYYSGSRYYLRILYDAAEGRLDLSDYKYVLNPYNTENAKLSRRPAKLRNYNIITPIIDLFLGEKNKEPLDQQVICTNRDVHTKYKESQTKVVLGIVAQSFVNTLNESGVVTNVPSQPVPDVNQAVQEHEANYDDTRAIIGQEALDFLKHSLRLKDKFLDAFYHWLVCGKVITRKDIYKDDVVYKLCHPMDVFPVGKSPSGNYEDSDAIIEREWATPTHIIANYSRWMSDDLVTYIEGLARTATNNSVSLVTQYGTTEVDTGVEGCEDRPTNIISTANIGLANQVEIERLVWKTYIKVGILSYTDSLGQLQELEVDDTYVLNKSKGDISIEWDWYTEWWEAVRFNKLRYLDKNEFANGGRAGVVQRQELANKSLCKLPYNGRDYSKPCLVKNGLVYQALYNILQFRFELTMARNKDKILMFPLGLIPSKEGWDEDTFMYYAESTGYAFYDETAPNASVALQGMKVQDLGLSQYAASMKDLIRSVKDEWWDSIGMNRQRYGDTMASDGKGNNEQAIFRSSLISSEISRQFKIFEEAELQGLIDTSQYAWVNGKQANYLNSEGRQAFFSVEPVEYCNASYGIFGKNNSDEKEKLDFVKSLIQPLAQNGVPGSTLTEVVDATNIGKAKKVLLKAEQYLQQLETSREKSAQESNERIAAMNAETQQHKDEAIKYKVDTESETAIKVALIQTKDSNSAVPDFDTDSYINDISESYNKLQASAANASANLDKKEAADKNLNLQNAKIEAGARKDEMAFKIAKTNKNKYDK